jgi:lipid-binding SYLF domain-containing protein
MTKTRIFLYSTISAIALSSATMAHAESDQQTLVDRARITINDLRHDQAFGNAKELMKTARAVLIVPRLYKGGFFVGGEGGNGVLLARQANGGWSEPAFYGIGSASFGLQIGLQQSEMVIFVMNQKALDAVMTDQFKVGANAGIAVATLGSGVEGATTGAAGADIVTWASSSGAYAGISINGSIIKPLPEENAAYYGHAATPQQIVYRGAVSNPNAAGLRESLVLAN